MAIGDYDLQFMGQSAARMIMDSMLYGSSPTFLSPSTTTVTTPVQITIGSTTIPPGVQVVQAMLPFRPAPEQVGWRDMASCPMDERLVLLLSLEQRPYGDIERYRHVGYRKADGTCWIVDDQCGGWMGCDPSGWAPIPA